VAFALSLAELAQMVGGQIVRGQLEATFTGMASLDAAGPQDISFLGNEKYRPLFLTTAAGAVIVGPGESAGPAATALIAVENPSFAFAAVVRHFAVAGRPFTPGVHARAWVDPSATLDPDQVCVHPGAVVMAGAVVGDGCEIGPNSVVGADAVLGRDCRLHSNVSIGERCVLGDRVVLQPGAVIGSDGYGYEFVNGRHLKVDQVGIVELGNDVEIGANTTIDRARFGKTVIGEGTKIDNLVQIAHNVVVGKHCLIISQSGMAGSSKLGDYVTVAAQVGIVGHVSVGDKAILGARTGVSANLEGGVTYLGTPAQPLMQEQKLRALIRRLPKLAEEVKALKKERA
jgi:UDP-3-O-[3-hydroxymyristoyl] glucosamine N-acyltransferase